jgi:menaquinone-specific isochorismate synthase
MTMRATTRPLHDGLDLLAEAGPGDFVFKRNGRGIVASGWAADVSATEASDVLASIDVEDAVRRRATGAIAVGALPFDGRSGRLRIPRRVVGVDADGAWETVVEGGDTNHDEPEPADVPAHLLDREEWAEAVRSILARIGAGDVEKVVLSRRVVIRPEGEFDVPSIVRRIAAARPDAWVYADGGFVGATPELLVSRAGRDVLSVPMAGTVAAESADSLLASPKLLHEFEVVVQAIAGTLGARCSDLAVGASMPFMAGNVAHLAAEVRGRLVDPAVTALDLAAALHPTPAVGGTPLDEALALIEKLEPSPRGTYAGPVGWLDRDGDGEFAVALRCATIRPDHAVLYAGCGIVAGSDPYEEWAETESKLVAMLDVLV